MDTESVNASSAIVQSFSFEGQAMPVHYVKGKPYWIVKDICECLGLGNPSDVSRRLKSKGIVSIDTLTPGGTQSTLACNEGNLYRLIMGARKSDRVEAFQDWVCDEVLPAIRLHGFYAMQGVQVAIDAKFANIEARSTAIEARLSQLEQTKLPRTRTQRKKGTHSCRTEDLEAVKLWLEFFTEPLQPRERPTPVRQCYAHYLDKCGSNSAHRVTFGCFARCLVMLGVPSELAYDTNGKRARSRAIALVH